jgi:hypothetical protein
MFDVSSVAFVGNFLDEISILAPDAGVSGG